MSGPLTVQANPSKRTHQNNDSGFATVIGGSAANGSAVGGGSAAACDASSGNAKKAVTTSPLSAALALKVTFIESLPIASQPFLTPSAEFILRKFACHFYAEEKAREMKSGPNYILSSAKKLGIVLQAMPEVQESQGFKTLCSNLTAVLEKFRVVITTEYVLKANDLNVEAKKTRYFATVCKWICGLAQVFIAQQNIQNYSEDVAVLDLIASNQDEVLASHGIPLPNFLAAYKGANNLQGIPTPTINFNFQEELNHANGTPNLGEEETPIPPDGTPAQDSSPAQQVTPPTPGYGALVVFLGGNQPESQIDDNKECEQEMVDATNAIESAAIGGRATICRLIFDAIVKGTIEPIHKLHAQRKDY
jgi:hypothetical protein